MDGNHLPERLRELGRQPIHAAAREQHRRRIEAVHVERRGRRFGVLAVAAAGVVGFMVGSTGLAMADALPDPAQDVAHDVLGVVQVEVPPGKEGKRGPCVAEAAKIRDKEAKQAAKDACPHPGNPDQPDTGDDPPPGRSGEAPGHTGDTPRGNGHGTTKHEGDPCRGRPPWAGRMSKEERDAAKQAHSRESCPPELDEESE